MNVTAGFAALGILLVLLALQVPIGVALILVSFGGIWFLLGLTPAVGILSATPYEFIASWTLSAVPMFLLMGFVAYHSGLTTGLFDAAKIATRKVPGGLGLAAIFGCTGFAAVSGSSIACAATMGRIAIPEMVRAGYRPSFSAGILAAGGTVGALIPPSILMIVYGVFAETSITQVFLGGISVGILTAISYSLVVILVAVFRKDIIPNEPAATDHIDGRGLLRDVVPLILLIVLVFGGLFGGLFTATEAGAIGAAGAIVIATVVGRLSWAGFRAALLETLGTCAALFIIGAGAAMFTRFLGLSGVAGFLNSTVSGLDLGYFGLMAVVVLIYILIGMFLEPFGAMLITLPILLPIFETQGIDLIWFGVLLVKLLEVGMITPPLGMNVFIIRSVAANHVSLGDVFKGALFFIGADIVVIALMIAFPDLVMFLPNL
ncbi:TRAP transporter large permease [Mesobaculum littorinae]|uniref:TRAP transporter large permease protein n=1 Tax=Mesobaculum littorinae TaxID=2486419 RepID=A0A438AHC2_9RHOB|nr:TRAP transporter large permease [Mesobaculum littorinae]RVV98123.1 TRAP transporter large permease [Mesobaculum littorinae]